MEDGSISNPPLRFTDASSHRFSRSFNHVHSRDSRWAYDRIYKGLLPFHKQRQSNSVGDCQMSPAQRDLSAAFEASNGLENDMLARSRTIDELVASRLKISHDGLHDHQVEEGDTFDPTRSITAKLSCDTCFNLEQQLQAVLKALQKSEAYNAVLVNRLDRVQMTGTE